MVGTEGSGVDFAFVASCKSMTILKENDPKSPVAFD